ncbi:MAG: DUF2164 domain-containing protein [Pseudomonas sp.]|uniref:DUF2164 domain-containing protein n=1 Tax=Pseudomonas sp. TaxID=306 RepID=UPI00272743A1|nr:DUF2164 domain-containing protein [Pseudomonas sp.]MDO9322388.1 DUF2164 domain-containing protein [Pseudomonas sp.]MDP3845801.1 DUF2164 domain-containing protein [Pseudomonas sp.]
MSRVKKPVEPVFQFSAQQRGVLGQAIKGLMAERFELEMGGFEAEELLDFFIKECGPLIYNQAVLDVQGVLKERFESIESDLWALEKS